MEKEKKKRKVIYVEVNDTLHKRVKTKLARLGLTVQSYIESLVREDLKK